VHCGCDTGCQHTGNTGIFDKGTTIHEVSPETLM